MAEPPPLLSVPAVRPALQTVEGRGWFVLAFGLYMLVKATALVFIGLYLNHWIHNPGHEIESLNAWIRYVHMDPDGKWIRHLLKTIGNIDTRQLQIASFGMFFYAFLHLIEGIGLVGRYRWGEWMVVVSTFALVPFEIYELVVKPKLFLVSALVVNILIGLYFIHRLRIQAEKPVHLSPAPTPSPTPPSTP